MIKAGDLTTVAGVGEAYRERLHAAGISTVGALAEASPDALIAVKGIGPARASTWIRQAQVQRSGTARVHTRWDPPCADFEISYDIEDFTPDDFVYLHGLLLRPSGSRRFGRPGFTEADYGVYRPVCAGASGSEEATWEQFLRELEQINHQGAYVVYVYSRHEQGALRRLSRKYGGSPGLELFMERFVDLYEVVRRTVVFPIDSTGLKPVARFLGFEWRDKDPGGAESMAWWWEYRKDPVRNAAALDRVLVYNEDDTRAAFVLRDWLEVNAV